MKTIIKITAISAVLALSSIGTAQAWWGGPGGSNFGPFDGNGMGDFNMNMRGSGSGYGNGYGNGYGAPYGYGGPGGYGAPYGYGAPGGYGAPYGYGAPGGYGGPGGYGR